MASAPKEIGHLVLNVSHVERSTKFYRDVVGLEIQARPAPISSEMQVSAT